jgi:hypothetical protein
MKKKLLSVSVLMLFMASTSYAQSFEDFISEVRGDTVVIKDLVDMNLVPNSLIDAIELDTDPPEGRVYELKNGGLYFQDRGVTLPDRPIQIVGDHSAPMVGGSVEEDGIPPLVAGTLDATGAGAQTGLLQNSNDLTVKNFSAVSADDAGTQGWFIFNAVSPNTNVTFDNLLLEHNNWVFVQSNDAAGTKLRISNSFLVNMTGHACRRNGGVYDNVNNNTDLIWVENSTHVFAAGMLYKFRHYPIGKAFFNHNTFVACAGHLFVSFGYQSDWTLVNNIFVNSNIQPYVKGLDIDQTDQDLLPHGIINVDTLTTGINPDRKILIDKNAVFWDSRLATIVPDANAANGGEHFDQMITMNSRTQAMFNDNATWPKLTEGSWILGEDPGFTQMDDLVPDLINWAVSSVPDENTFVLGKWRSPENPATPENYAFVDFPLAGNFTYSNEAMLTGAMGGFPLGDLNWYPEQKAAWLAQRDAELAELDAALNEGRLPNVTSVKTDIGTPSSFSLEQNYPNPFNPTTTIAYELQTSGDVKLQVFDVMGRVIGTLVDQHQSAGKHQINFDAQNLASGSYYYRITTKGFTETKQMTLIK